MTKPRSTFDRAAATLWLLAAVTGLGVGAAIRLYQPAPVAASGFDRSPPSVQTDVPTVVVVRRASTQPLARTRAS